MPSLIGNKPNQVPTNGDLGTLAFQDSNAVQITGGIVDVNAGSATVASLGASGDENTGLFFPAADTLAATTGGTERMRITSSGSVLVNQTSATNYQVFGGIFSTGLQISGTTVDSSGLAINRYGNVANGANIVLAHSRGASIGTNTIVANGDPLGLINFNGANGTGYDIAAQIRGEVDGTPGASNDMPGRLVFLTTADGASTPTERMRIDSSGNVGIGTNSPSSYYATQLVVNGGADGGITVVNTTTGDARLMFADGTAGDARYAGQIVYNHGNNYMMFGTNGGTERMRISSGGSLLFGTTDSLANITNSSGTGLALYNSNGNTQFLGTNANDTVAQLNRQGSNGELIVFRRDGNSIGNISGTTTGVTLVGTNGITFTATQTASADANTLDDYEEGTFTPNIRGSGTAGTVTYTAQIGRYTKIGNVCRFQIYLNWTNWTGSPTGGTWIEGLPFSSKSGSSIFTAITTYIDGAYSLSANNTLQGYINQNVSYVTLAQTAIGGGAATDPPFDTSAAIMVSGIYEVN